MATKQLAKKLGLVQKCSNYTKSNKLLYNESCQKQNFEFLLVLDFESTCWDEKGMKKCQEIIEFPVVLLELSCGRILSEFHQYVLPLEHPILSEFCINLTGIQQSQVDNGVPLPTAISLFSSWLRKLSQKYEFSFNVQTPGKHIAFATWSDWDLGVCLHYECTRKQLKKPDYFNHWIDVRLTYKNFYGRIPQGLAGALQDLGMKFEGREHSGIIDAKNTAALIFRMAKESCGFEITKTLNARHIVLKVAKNIKS